MLLVFGFNSARAITGNNSIKQLLCVKNKMEIFYSITFAILIISIIAWLFTWSQACSFLKEPKALAFFFWPNVFFSLKFKSEGEKQGSLFET